MTGTHQVRLTWNQAWPFCQRVWCPQVYGGGWVDVVLTNDDLCWRTIGDWFRGPWLTSREFEAVPLDAVKVVEIDAAGPWKPVWFVFHFRSGTVPGGVLEFQVEYSRSTSPRTWLNAIKRLNLPETELAPEHDPRISTPQSWKWNLRAAWPLIGFLVSLIGWGVVVSQVPTQWFVVSWIGFLGLFGLFLVADEWWRNRDRP